MRDYWLTQYILSAIGWGYLIAVLLVVALVLWLVKGRTAKIVSLLVVIGLASVLPWQGYQEYAKEKVAADAYRVRLAKAQALFDERCKTAGEKIHKTVENVEGLIWLKWRPSGLSSEQFALDDPYGKDCSMEGCIYRLLIGADSAKANQGEALKPPSRYKFIETIHPVDGVRYRYSGISKAVSDVSQEEFSQHVKTTGYGADSTGRFLALKREPINEFSLRFGILWEDVSLSTDREFWIAGGSLKILDIQKNEILAERIGYLLDTGQGSTAGFRDPWGWAQSYAPKCPRKIENTLDFALRVLQPAQ